MRDRRELKTPDVAALIRATLAISVIARSQRSGLRPARW